MRSIEMLSFKGDPVLIREFLEEDRESLRNIYFVTRKKVFGWLDGDSLKESDFDKDTEGERIWICGKPEQIVGFISVWEPENFIHHLFVLPEFARLGCGSHLLKVCMANISRPVQLKCLTQNTDAMSFYQSKGWYTISKGISSDGEYHLMQASEI